MRSGELHGLSPNIAFVGSKGKSGARGRGGVWRMRGEKMGSEEAHVSKLCTGSAIEANVQAKSIGATSPPIPSSFPSSAISFGKLQTPAPANASWVEAPTTFLAPTQKHLNLVRRAYSGSLALQPFPPPLPAVAFLSLQSQGGSEEKEASFPPFFQRPASVPEPCTPPLGLHKPPSISSFLLLRLPTANPRQA